MSERLLGRRALVILSAVVGLSLLVGLIVSIFGDELLPVRSSGADAFSRSALGHRAFVELLEENGVPVLVARRESLRAPHTRGRRVLRVLAEPRPGEREDLHASLQEGLRDSRSYLLVLPKWEGQPAAGRSGWVGAVRRLEDDEVLHALSATGIEATLVRPARPAQATDPWPAAWDVCALPHEPTLTRPQLLRSEELTPLIACSEGVLLGQLPDGGAVLSDPDLIATHGLAAGDNDALALDMVRFLLPPRGTVVIDERIHGHGIDEGFWRGLFTFPVVLALAHAALAGLLLVWSAVRRFGPPEPLPAPIHEGKRPLIDNTAELLLQAGHDQHVLRRYLRETLRAVGSALHLERGLREDELCRRLDESAHGRASEVKTDVLLRAVRSEAGQPRGALRAARLIHRWKEGMLHGVGPNS